MSEFLKDEHGQVCDGAERGFTSPCSEAPRPGKNGSIICDRHEVERRAELCKISPRQWLRNVGRDDESITSLFPDETDVWYTRCPDGGHEYVPTQDDCPVCNATAAWAVMEAEDVTREVS